MQPEHKKVKPSMYITQETLDKIDALKVADHTVSGRGEIVDKAIDFYKSHIDLKQDVDQFAPIIKAIIENTMNVYHERLNRNIFKLATEVGVNSLFLSKMVETDKETYEKVRLLVVDEVKRTKGTISIYDAQDKK